MPSKMTFQRTPPARGALARVAPPAILLILLTAIGATSPRAARVAPPPFAAGAAPDSVAPRPGGAAPTALPLAVALEAEAAGRSRGLLVRTALPGELVRPSLVWKGGPPARLSWSWRRIGAGDVPAGEPSTDAAGGPTLLGAPVRARPVEPAATLAAGEPYPADGLLPAPMEPGAYALRLSAPGRGEVESGVRLLVAVPLERKVDGFLDGYFIGRYPTEGAGRVDRYAPPPGFFRVTRELAELQISEHFRLAEFLTHDQQDVWPKYVVVDTLLLDKLELVLDELEAGGVPARRMVVMSGFRTPQYNRKGLDRGRASLSRHQWGDAADVWVDNDGDWYMDDLNGDGRRDTGDARVMLGAVARVEARHPELRGGAGVYRDNGVHGPFLHIDTRGSVARW